MATKLGTVTTYYSRLPSIKFHSLEACGQVRTSDKLKTYICTTTLPTATKLGRVMTYREGLLLIKLPGHLITWSCKITWKIRKCFISTITMLTNAKLSSVVAYGERLRPIKSNDHLNKWYVRSRDRLKTLNLNAYGTHTCQGGDIRLVAPTQKVIWPFNHVLWF